MEMPVMLFDFDKIEDYLDEKISKWVSLLRCHYWKVCKPVKRMGFFSLNGKHISLAK
jgi:hypothetical protein